MHQRIFGVSNKWFFTQTPWYVKAFLLIYINGDYFFLLPLVVGVAISYLFSLQIGLFLTGAYVFLRHFGEMIYWLLQQFGPRTYRPKDFGVSKLDNNAIYILYQTYALLGMIFGVTLMYVSFL